METTKQLFPLGLSFDDVLLIPNYAGFSRSDIDLFTKLTKKITLTLPFISAPMDTVTESKLAIALARLGGIGIIHRNLTVQNQANEVKKVHSASHSTVSSDRIGSGSQKLLVGAAIGASKGFEDRVEALVKVGVDVLVVDSAHGYSKGVIETTQYIKKKFPKMEVIAGNVATYAGAKALILAGADGIRVGMGPGAICTTRIISGMGVPQVTAILETVRASKKAGIPIIADGGIKYSGDMIKALAAGASAIMMGSFFASTIESPGKIVSLRPEQVPSRFKSSLNKKLKIYKFKEYRGMGSIAAMARGVKIKSEGEFHGKSYKDRVMIAEGVESLVPLKGSIEELIDQVVGGIRSGMYYVGAKNIQELWEKARFMQITQASLTESHPHDVLITNPGKNY